MGEIYKLTCECGYAKELNIGGGLASHNLNTVNRIFPKEKLEDFINYYKSKRIQSFLIENKLAYCEKCNEITTASVLKVQLSNNDEIEIINNCSVCGNKLQIINNLPTCPKCGRKMVMQEIGCWD